MKLAIGDKVRFLNEKGAGRISDFTNRKTALVEIEAGFVIPFPISELVKVEPDMPDKSEISLLSLQPIKSKTPKFTSKALQEKFKKDKSSVWNQKATSVAFGTLEIDLHIEEIIDDFSGLSNGEIVHIQLLHCRKTLDAAIVRNIGRVIVIHGVGNGTLKREVWQLLKTYNNIQFHDAPNSRFGHGATEVLIK